MTEDNRTREEKVRVFLNSSSVYDIIYEFCGKPKDVILLGSGTDLDTFDNIEELIDKTQGTVVKFNNRAIGGRTDVWMANRAHGSRIIKTVRNNKLNSKIVLFKHPLKDKQTHGTINKHTMIVLYGLQDPLTDLTPSSVGRLSTGFYGSIFLKFCERIYMAGFDGYKNLGRKKYTWHSKANNGKESENIKISGKHHDYSEEYKTIIEIIRQRKTDAYASRPACDFFQKNGIGVNEWKS